MAAGTLRPAHQAPRVRAAVPHVPALPLCRTGCSGMGTRRAPGAALALRQARSLEGLGQTPRFWHEQGPRAAGIGSLWHLG